MFKLELTLEEVDLLILALHYADRKVPFWNEKARESLKKIREQLIKISLEGEG